MGHGTLDLRHNTVLPMVQLRSRVTVRTGVGLTLTRHSGEVVMPDLDSASF